MKTFWLSTLSALVLGASALGGAALAQNSTSGNVPAFTHPDTVSQDLSRLDLALNNTGTMAGTFSQSSDAGAPMTGKFYLQRPGKIRFEYDAPMEFEIISDGVTILQRDNALGTEDRIPLRSTPLHFFLKSEIRLQRDTKVVALQKYDDATTVTVQDANGQTQGTLTLVFNEPNLALREWTVADEFGVTTRVVLSNLSYNQELDPRLFILRNDRDDRRRR